jgi:hypothetical protein
LVTDGVLKGCCPEAQPDANPWGTVSAWYARGLALTALVLLVVWWFVRRARHRRPPARDLVAAPVLALLSYFVFLPLVSVANVGLDHSPAQRRQVPVLSMYSHYRYGKHAQTTYYVVVPSWRADYGARMDLPVSFDMYHQTRVGTQITVVSHAGGLGAEWLDEKADPSIR